MPDMELICLSVNSANRILTVSIDRESGQNLYRFETDEMRNQGNLLLSHIDKGMQATGVTYSDLGLLAVATGPGSFTGIRIGIAAMRGIALAADRPLVGIDSFALFGEGAGIVALESFRDELYLQAAGSPAVNMTAEDFAAAFPMQNPHIRGDAAEKMLPFYKGATASAEPENMAVLAAQRWRAGVGDLEKPSPYYLRPADISTPTKAKNGTIVA